MGKDKPNKGSKKKSSKNNSIVNTLLDDVQKRKNKRLAEQQKTSKKSKVLKAVATDNKVLVEGKLKADILRFNEEGYKVIVFSMFMISSFH